MNPGTIVRLSELPDFQHLSSDSSTVTLNNGDRIAVSDSVVYAWEGGNGAQVKPSTADYVPTRRSGCSSTGAPAVPTRS